MCSVNDSHSHIKPREFKKEINDTVASDLKKLHIPVAETKLTTANPKFKKHKNNKQTNKNP